MSSIDILIEKEYLLLPVSAYVGKRSVSILKNGQLLDDFRLRLDFVTPSCTVSYKVSEYKGQNITIEVSPDIDLSGLADLAGDTPARARPCRFRPFIHFTAPFGWLNDPNGLVVYTSPVTERTSYHLFYQHNPYDWVWENMHWGHAVSEDLFHWTDLGDALSPDENGTMFSGSAIVDHENRSGLKRGDEDVILLFYTCAGNRSLRSAGKTFTQNIAYSVDGGKSFVKYERNPVISNIAGENRDPKVIWCDEIGKFLMALYLSGNEYALFTSADLLSWEELQRITIAGEAECPDIYPVTVEGSGERRWVLSGASHHYITGEMADGRFQPSGAVKHLNYGRFSYAAQTFSQPDGGRRIQMAWDRRAAFGDDPICGQMGIPCELSLVKEGEEYYLCALPVRECEKLYADEQIFENQLTGPDAGLSVPMERGAYDIRMIWNTAGQKACITMDLFGQRIVFDAAENLLHIADETMPLAASGDLAEIRLVIDRATAEVFVNDGRAIMTVLWLLDLNQNTCVLRSDMDIAIDRIEIRKLML